MFRYRFPSSQRGVFRHWNSRFESNEFAALMPNRLLPPIAIRDGSSMSASLIGHSGSSAFRLSTAPVSMSLVGSRFSSESAPRPFHHGVRDEVEQSLARHCR